MQYIVKTNKTVAQAFEDLKVSITNHKFSVLHVHDLHATFNSKGIDFDNECLILEVCNPNFASKILNTNMSLNMALPCRISVYKDKGETNIGMMLPTALIQAFTDDKKLLEIAAEVEEINKQIIDKVK